MKIRELIEFLSKQQDLEVEVFSLKGGAFAFPIEDGRMGTLYQETKDAEHDKTFLIDEGVVDLPDPGIPVKGFILYDANDVWEHSP